MSAAKVTRPHRREGEGMSDKRRCSHCCKRKPLTEFARRWDHPNRVMPWCRQCKRAYDAKTVAAKRARARALEIRP